VSRWDTDILYIKFKLTFMTCSTTCLMIYLSILHFSVLAKNILLSISLSWICGEVLDKVLEKSRNFEGTVLLMCISAHEYL
jgi:hypothetical protein